MRASRVGSTSGRTSSSSSTEATRHFASPFAAKPDAMRTNAPAAESATARFEGCVAQQRPFAKTAPWLDRAIALMNDALVPDMAGGKFLSLFAAVVDPRDGRMEWCNAGHNPPLLFRASDRSVKALEGTGRILGILPGEPCGPGEPVKMEPGDALLLYTDGVTEARGGGGDLFGQERLESVLAVAAQAEPEAILDKVRGALRDFTGGAKNNDDVTMVAVKRA